MIKIFILPLLMIVSMPVQSQNCICETILDEVISATELNYSLFQFKVSQKKGNTSVYNTFKNVLKEKSLDAKADKDCDKIIQIYISFFYDEHLWAEVYSYQEIVQYKENIKIDSTVIYEKYKSTTNPILGIWETPTYRVAIIENTNDSRERDYVAVILTSANPNFSLGDVKMEFKKQKDSYDTNFMLGDFSLRKTVSTVFSDSHIDVSEINSWRKVFPLPKDKKPVPFHEIDESAVYFKDIGNNNYYFRIGSFGGQNREIVESIVNENKVKLSSANYLIIDIRGNGGGSDYTYFPLLPYVYSGDVQLFPMAIWTSKYNKENYFNDWLSAKDSLEKTPFYSVMQNPESQLFYWEDEDYVQSLDTIYPNPKQVAILADNESASSAETFILRSKQSDRVTTFGQNTSGTVDGFNGTTIKATCYRLTFPTSIISINYPEDGIDPHGIYPDIYLSNDKMEVIPFIIDYLSALKE